MAGLMAGAQQTFTRLTGRARQSIPYRLNGDHDIKQPAPARAPITGPAVQPFTAAPPLTTEERRAALDVLVASMRTARAQDG